MSLTVGDLLKRDSGLSGVSVGTMLKAMGTGSTVGDLLKSYSGLTGSTVGQMLQVTPRGKGDWIILARRRGRR